MAMTLQAAVRPIKGLEVAKVPVGKALIFTGAMGVGDFLKALTFSFTQGRFPQWVTGGLVAWALLNMKMLRNLLGADIAELAALALVADTINDSLGIRERTANLLGGFLPGRPGVVSKSPPVLTAGRGRVTPRAMGRQDIYSSLFGR